MIYSSAKIMYRNGLKIGTYEIRKIKEKLKSIKKI